MDATSVAVALTCLVLAGPVVLTGLGARRRGNVPLVVVLAALAFPLTWVVWYVRDERPWSRA